MNYNITDTSDVDFEGIKNKVYTSIRGFPNVVRHAMPKIAEIRLNEYTAEEFLRKLVEPSFRNVCALMCQTTTYPRSSLIKPLVQGKDVEWSVGVPFVPYIYKKYNDVPYSAWNFDDPKFKFIVGDGLGSILKFKDYDFSNFTVELLQEIDSLTYWEKAPHKVKRLVSNDMEITIEWDTFPELLKLMLLQRWIFSDNSKYLVKNPLNWEAEPLFDLGKVVAPEVNVWDLMA